MKRLIGCCNGGAMKLSVALFLVIFYLQFVPNANCVAVMSVDLGSEWMKIGIVSPGVPMEIVLNKESKRKTPVAVSFRDGERLIGDDALNVAVRFPPNAYLYFMDLLGKRIENPIVQLFMRRFPYYNIVSDPDRGTVLFQHDSTTFYSPEELLGMVLSKARDYAQDFANQPVKEAVITVPPFFNQAERRAVLNAAQLADIKVLQLMNSNTAGALNYGIFRRKDFNETAQHLLLYDMGASSTVATVVSYQITKTKEKGIVETNPQLTVLGVGYDRTLGGLEMQLRLRDFLAKSFNEMKKTKTDIFTNHRSMAKLFKEAGRLKNILSANTDHYAQVEGLLEELDFKLPVSRSQFESLCSDLFSRVSAPVEQALKAASLTMDVVDQVILLGAGTRVPKVQEKLVENLKRELGKSLNTDESGAMGGVYKGADLSSGFKVKKFITKDAVLFPILVDFEREIESDEGSKGIKIVRRTLFSHMNPYPQKKILTFNKNVNDFTFYVSYGELPVSAEEALAVGSSNITKVDLKGVGAALQKNNGEGVESKGVKAHFNLDESGIFSLTLVESVFEKNSTFMEDVEDTFSKLGSAFTKLFSSSGDEAKGVEQPENSDDLNSENETTGKTDANSEKIVQDDASGKGNESKLNSTNEEKLNSSSAEVPKSKIITIKEPLEVTTFVLDVLNLEGDKFKESATKLKELNEADRVRSLKEKARNALESYVSDMQHKVYSSEFELFVKDEEKEAIGAFCTEASDWLYEDGSDTDKETYENKLKSLKKLTRDFEDRVKEHKDRPDALEALDKMLNISTGFLESSKLLPSDMQYFSEVEIKSLEKVVKETLEWREKKLEEQEKAKLSDAPIITIRMIAEKLNALDREVKYMMNKARVEKLKKERDEERNKEKAAENKTDETLDEKSKKSTDDSDDKSKKIEENESKSEAESGKIEPEPTEKEKKDEHTEL